MNNDKLATLREFANWVRFNIGKSANIDISIWCHASNGDESTEYGLWIDGLINKKSKNLDELVGMIPRLKEFCELSMELAS